MPVLTGAALRAVQHRGSHVQIIASAGSGKTEVVSQRVVELLVEGAPPDAIVAFTFTERAAEELKNRIIDRVLGRPGEAMVDQLGGLLIGTIHAFCFRLLQQRVPRYETYDVLDDNQLTAFLSREAKRLELRELVPRDRTSTSRSSASPERPGAGWRTCCGSGGPWCRARSAPPTWSGSSTCCSASCRSAPGTCPTRWWSTGSGPWRGSPRCSSTDADERRLFYVALTRARDWLSVSRHDRVTTNRVAPSPYHQELSYLHVAPDAVTPPPIETADSSDDAPISMTYSQLAAFMGCGMAFRLRELIGFQPRLAPELGYGKAVHHVMRAVANATQATGRVPTDAEVDDILQQGFFLPSANKPAHRQLRDAARRLVTTYIAEHEDDLHRVWETERPFELHLDGITVTGRADVILDQESDVPTALAIVDYKTSTTGEAEDHALQLQVYADAGRREGLDVRGAYVHDLKAAARLPVAVDPTTVGQAEATVAEAAARVRARDYHANPGQRCRTCEVRTICDSAVR